MAGAGNEKRWDVCVVAALDVGLIAGNVVIPFDSKRYGWSSGLPAQVFVHLVPVIHDNTFLAA
jgi:hypothetical protein